MRCYEKLYITINKSKTLAFKQAFFVSLKLFVLFILQGCKEERPNGSKALICLLTAKASTD